LDARKVNIVES